MDQEIKDEIIDDLTTEENEVVSTEATIKSSEEENVGNVKISMEVVSTISGIAAAEIAGVAYMYSSFAGGIAEMLGGKKNPAKGVKVEMIEDKVNIDLYLVVDYGVRIPELAWEVQENVKNNIETMTGLSVEKVNIHIEGVNFAKEDNDENLVLETSEPKKITD